MKNQGLCELHLHLYGCLRHDDVLDRIVAMDDVDWTFYEQAYLEAFGHPSVAREVVDQAKRGEGLDSDRFQAVFEFGEADAGNFSRFSAKFNLLIVGSCFPSALAGRQPWDAVVDEVVEVSRSVLADQRLEGLGWAEQRLRPGEQVPPEVVRRLWAGVLAAYRESPPGLEARLTASLPRHDPWTQWEIAEELALGPDGQWLTGIDFCHIEEGFPPRAQAPFFDALRDFNNRNPERALALLYHVGESFNDKSIESAIRWVQEAAEVGAHRLGHAIALGIDPDHFGPHTRSECVSERRDQIRYDLLHAAGLERAGVRIDGAALEAELLHLEEREADDLLDLVYDEERLKILRKRQDFAMERVRSTGAIIEVCPTSNRRIAGLTESRYHPVHRFLERGLPIVVAADDPGIFGVRLDEEIDWVVDQTGIGSEGREALVQAAWDARSERLVGRSCPE